MAEILANGQLKLNNGQIITPQVGGWYDARQYWNGTLSAPGVINSQSNQPGAGQAVNPTVVAQSNPDQGLKPGTNEAYIASQTQLLNPTGGTGASASTTNGTAGTTGTVSGVVSETQKAYDSLNSTMNAKRTEADKRRSEVNENPFLAEASRVGRIAKIDSALNDSLATEQIQLTALEKKLAAEAEAAKPDLMITTETDNAGNVSIITVDKKTGKLVGVASGGKVGKADKPSSTDSAKATLEQYKQEIQAAAQNWVTLQDLLATYVSLGVDPNDIYAIYNSSSKWGAADTNVWTPERLKQVGIDVPATKSVKTTEIDPKTGAIKITE